jgi:flagella basal body P-ring formation protein FlgA
MNAMTHVARNLLFFLVATAILAGACLLRAEPVANPAERAPALAPVEAPVPAVATPLTRDQLLATLAHDLSSHFNLEGDLQLDLVRAWAPPAQVASVWQVHVLEYPSFAGSSMLVRCRVAADGANVAETTFVLRAALWRDAWVTRQPLVVGSTFDASALDARRVDLFRERDVLPAAVGDSSYIFARAVQAGRLLTWRDISRRPLVKKGELVEVSAIDGLLVVTMKGLAMENGARGDTVTVRNPESRKDFAAMVVDENRVQVRF